MEKDNKVASLEAKIKDLESDMLEERQAHFLIEQRQRSRITHLELENGYLTQQVEGYRGEVKELGALLDKFSYRKE